MVCDVFVCSIWKAGGLFGDLADSIQCSEQTPRDIAQMKLFDETTPRPEACKVADAALPYCQINGEYRIDLPAYNTITPYANMGEHCPGLPPNYVRPSDC